MTQKYRKPPRTTQKSKFTPIHPSRQIQLYEEYLASALYHEYLASASRGSKPPRRMGGIGDLIGPDPDPALGPYPSNVKHPNNPKNVNGIPDPDPPVPTAPNSAPYHPVHNPLGSGTPNPPPKPGSMIGPVGPIIFDRGPNGPNQALAEAMKTVCHCPIGCGNHYGALRSLDGGKSEKKLCQRCWNECRGIWNYGG